MNKKALPVIVGLAALLVYLPALKNGFVNWDDGVYVYENVRIRAITPDFLSWAFLKFHASNWHPLTWISHALDYAVWGLNPMGHHLTSVVLHSLNTGLVTLLVLRLSEIVRLSSIKGSPAGRTERGDLLMAAVTGLLFGLHPLHVESAAWVSERKDVLSSLFFLLSIMAYLSYAVREKDRPQGRPFLDRAYLACLSLFALSVMAKSMTVTLPLVLLVLDWYPLARISSQGSARRLLMEKAPFFIISLAAGLLAIAAQTAEGSVASLADLSLPVRLLVSCKALVAYLGKIIWPEDLMPFYPYPQKISAFSPEYLLPLLLAAGISAGTILLARRNKIWPALWACYVVTLLPTLGIIQVGQQEMADRYMYLPSISPFLFAGLCVRHADTLLTGLSKGKTAARWALGGVLFAAVSALAVLSWQQIKTWQSGMTLWNNVIAIRQDIPRAYANRAELYFKTNRLQEALDDYTRAIVIYEKNPDDMIAAYHYDRAYTAQALGRYQEALGDYSMAIRLPGGRKPGYLFARGSLYALLQRNDEAVADYSQAISTLQQPDAAYHAARAAALGKLGRYREAEEDYMRAVSIKPDVPDLYYNLGNLYAATGRLQEAVGAYTRAIGMTPSPHPDYLRNRALVMEKLAAERSSGR